jgi:hypothetical protein
MSPAALTILLVTLNIAAPADSAASDSFALSGFVGGWNGPGWWRVEIDTTGRMEVMADRRITRRLAPAQRATLARLVAALPVERLTYDFGGPGPVDATAIFALTIQRGSVKHEYYFNDHSPREPAAPGLVALRSVWRFLRDLFESDEAADPGPITEASPSWISKAEAAEQGHQAVETSSSWWCRPRLPGIIESGFAAYAQC